MAAADLQLHITATVDAHEAVPPTVALARDVYVAAADAERIDEASDGAERVLAAHFGAWLKDRASPVPDPSAN